MSALDDLLENENPTPLEIVIVIAAGVSPGDNFPEQAAQELADMRAAIEAARVVLSMYANRDNWVSHDGFMYLKTLSHPWGDAAVALAKLGAK